MHQPPWPHNILPPCVLRGIGRNFRRGFPPIVDPRCRGLGAQPPEADGYFKTLCVV